MSKEWSYDVLTLKAPANVAAQDASYAIPLWPGRGSGGTDLSGELRRHLPGMGQNVKEIEVISHQFLSSAPTPGWILTILVRYR